VSLAPRLVVFLTVAACVSFAACGDTEAPSPDANTPEVVDINDIADIAEEDAPDLVEPDTSDVVPPSDTSGLATIFALSCRNDSGCKNACATGTCVDGICVFPTTNPDRTGCIVPFAGDAPAQLPLEPLYTCAPPGTAASDSCGLCEPRERLTGYTNVLFSENFDTGGGQFLFERRAFSTAGWSIDTYRSNSGRASLYFGDPDIRSYGVGVHAAVDAVTRPLVAIADDVPYVLTFNIFADTEEKAGFDTLTVLVREPDDTETVYWSTDDLGGTTLGDFARVRVTIPALPDGSRLVFRADSIDEIINDFEGFYLDDLRLIRACCDTSAACDDADTCTASTCEDGRCVFETDPTCCGSAHDCRDTDQCTRDTCDLTAGLCGHVDVEGCCRADADCNDSDACTTDVCGVDGVCGNIPTCCEIDRDCDDGDLCTLGTCDTGICRYTNSCCTDNAECDDGDRCTHDSCGEGLCQNDFNYAVGCCLPNVLTERFNGATTDWTLSPATNNIGWRQLNSATAPSGGRMLFYGHPTLLFYESGGRNQGSATSPPRRLPQGVQSYFSVSIRLDIESEAARDLLSVELVVGQRTVVLGTKATLTYGAWQDVQYDLSWAAGQTVQVRFRFDTVDGVQNTGRGISIDDAQIYSDCQPRACDAPTDCPSRLDCLIPECEANVCIYRGVCD